MSARRSQRLQDELFSNYCLCLGLLFAVLTFAPRAVGQNSEPPQVVSSPQEHAASQSVTPLDESVDGGGAQQPTNSRQRGKAGRLQNRFRHRSRRFPIRNSKFSNSVSAALARLRDTRTAISLTLDSVSHKICLTQGS